MKNALRNYVQIQEDLAIVMGGDNFHYYRYGRPFIAVTDHKPLLGIVNKSSDSLSVIFLKLLIKLLEYDVTLR